MISAGGTFALYARIARVAKLPTPTATEQEFDTNLSRYGTKLATGVKPNLSTYVSIVISHLSPQSITILDGVDYKLCFCGRHLEHGNMQCFL